MSALPLRPAEQQSAYIRGLVARAPRPTTEQARNLIVLFTRGLARAETRQAS